MSTIEELQADLFAEWRARESLIDKIKTLEDEVLVARRFAVSVVGQQAETQTLAEVVNGLAVVNHALKTRLAALEAQLAEVTRERDALKLHYDAAAPEHNLLALLDLYHDREQAAVSERDTLRALVAVGREMARRLPENSHANVSILAKWRSLEGK